MSNVKNDFNNWHQDQNIDFEANTEWHNFAKAKLNSFDFINSNILEIGCGRGGFALWFNKDNRFKVQQYYAADFSDVSIQKAKDFIENKKGFEKLTFIQEDIQNISFPDNYFDFIFSFETVEHVPYPRKAIDELSRVLKPNGVLFLTTPNYLGFFGLYRIYLRLTGRRWTEVGQPINKFTIIPKTMLWLRNSKLKVIEWDSKIISVPFPGKKLVVHFNWNRPRFFFKWFGLQSFFVCRSKKII